MEAFPPNEEFGLSGSHELTQNVESYLDLSERMADDPSEVALLEELKQLLPGLPASRLRRVRQAYTDTLSDPSLVTLVPILRETMPVSQTILLSQDSKLFHSNKSASLAAEGLVHNQDYPGGEFEERTLRDAEGGGCRPSEHSPAKWLDAGLHFDRQS